ncbi:hypothetical protein Tco_1260969 [Tanacetum coccineum]
MKASTVTVKGIVGSKELIVFISKKAGRHAEVVVPKKEKGQMQNQNQNDGEHKDNEKKNKDKDGKNIGLSYPNVPQGISMDIDGQKDTEQAMSIFDLVYYVRN